MRFADYYYDKNGNIDSMSCSYDETGRWEEPKDLTGTSQFSCSEDLEDILNEDLSAQ